jgi:hypothetical protein
MRKITAQNESQFGAKLSECAKELFYRATREISDLYALLLREIAPLDRVASCPHKLYALIEGLLRVFVDEGARGNLGSLP